MNSVSQKRFSPHVLPLFLFQPANVVGDLLFWLEALRGRLKKIDADAKSQKKILLDRLKERAARRFGEKHPDK